MSDGTHCCPIAGCRVQGLPYARLMCLKHWRRVPHELQQVVYDSWQDGRPDRAYPQIPQMAIDAVEKAIAADLGKR